MVGAARVQKWAWAGDSVAFPVAALGQEYLEEDEFAPLDPYP